MMYTQMLQAWVATHYLAMVRRVRGSEAERGDVPGWVMVTVMTAGLVVAIFAVFKGQITTAVTNALSDVTGNTKGN